MTVTVMIQPANEVSADAVAKAANAAIENAMRGAVQIVVNDAKRSVARGPKTGRVYRRGNITHQASAPGEPPATDTGVLVNSIVGDVTRAQNNQVQGYVRAGAGYAGYLEFGTRRMAARPFLFPAIERNRVAIQQFLQRAMQTAANRFRTK